MAELRNFISQLSIVDKARGSILLGPNMTPAQDRLLTVVESDIAAGKPVRIVIAKARQMGFSTMVEAIMFAHCFMLEHFRGLIVSHQGDSNEHLLGISKHYWETFPFRQAYHSKYLAANRLGWSETDSQIHVATAKSLASARSTTLHGLHGSECAFWDHPETLLAGLSQTIPRLPLTFQFFESTSYGVGNWWHRKCQSARSGDDEFTLIFFGWWEHPDYCASKVGRGDLLTGPFIPRDDEERALERFLTRQGHDLGTVHDKLHWRRLVLSSECQGNIDTFHQEYPTTLDESFVSSGRNVFPIEHLRACYQPETGTRGDLHRQGRDIRFIPNPDGHLTVFRYPQSADLAFGVYALGADPSWSARGDYGTIQILNRNTWEQVAIWRDKCDARTIGEQCDLLGRWYNDSLAAPEATKGGGAAVGVLMGRNYPNIFIHRKIGNTKGQLDTTYGWVTNAQTKPEAISNLQKALYDAYEHRYHDLGLVIHDAHTFTELKEYVVLDNGGFGNSSGTTNDDTVMSLAIALSITMYEAVSLTGTDVPTYNGAILAQPTRSSRIEELAGDMEVAPAMEASDDHMMYDPEEELDAPWLDTPRDTFFDEMEVD